MSYVVKIVQYRENVGGYAVYDSIEQTEYEAIERARSLRQSTGKCYGVFGPDGKVYDTSPYYAAFKLPEWKD
jgi:hypothetical protein